MAETLKLIYETAKVRLGFLIMSCAMAGIAVSPSSHTLTSWQVLILGLGVLASSAAAGAFNQLYERDLDAAMDRTNARPFVTGRFRADFNWYAGISIVTLLGVGAAAWATNAIAALHILLGALTYGVVYTVWLKRRTWWNIVFGGLAGSFAVLAGAAATGEAMAPAPLILAVVLFLWTPPHFWALAFACKSDYKSAGVPMLPIVVSDRTSTRTIFVHAVVLVLLSLLLAGLGMGWIYLVSALGGGIYFVASSLKLMLRPETRLAWHTFAASIVQLGLLLTGAVMDRLILG